MSEIIVNGGKSLCGEINVQGAKNSVLPILSATVLCKGVSVIHNCPELSDVYAALDILKALGCKCSFENSTVTVDASFISYNSIPENLMREMRSSVVFLGAIIGRTGSAVISNPGGCELGPRPIDLHLFALRKLGVCIEEKHGDLLCSSTALKGTDIYLSFPSVGATENVMLCASRCEGVTVLRNAAHEPEIVDLADFLNSSGADIKGAGTDTVVIKGVSELKGTEHTVIPDRIAACTYLTAAAVTKGNVTVKNVVPEHISSVISVFEQCGCNIRRYANEVNLTAPLRLKHVPSVMSHVYPGFPTDSGPLCVAMLSLADGVSVFTETIFENRFKYIDELKRLGADIKVTGKTAVIRGVDTLWGASCVATDLRAGAALVLAGLAAKGETRIKNTCYIKRGYENIVRDLALIGADIYEE